MNTTTLRIEQRGPVAWVTLDRPDALNAFNRDMREEMIATMTRLADDASVRVVVLTGSGRAFSAGGDIKLMEDRGPAAEAEHVQRANRVVWQIGTMSKPVIAAVNGHAYGAGLCLALAADVVIASDKATFCSPFVKLGLMPTMGATYFLPRQVGLLKAKYLALTGRAIDAREAERIGLVTEVVPHDELVAAATAMADHLAQLSPAALAAIKGALTRSTAMDYAAVLAAESSTQGVLWDTEEHKSAVRAFLERPRKNAGTA